ncbi:MAG: peptidyl-prolyl cis-trans isomerase [Candidatus Latescibacterota bacterium]
MKAKPPMPIPVPSLRNNKESRSHRGTVALLGVFALGMGLALLPLGCQPTEDQPQGVVLARVGDATLTLSELLAVVPDDVAGSLSLDSQKRMVERWMEEQLLYQEALRRGIDREEPIQRLIESSKVDLVVSELIAQLGDNHAPTEDELLQYYNEHQDEFAREEDEIWARHVLVATRAEAQRIRTRILAGEAFDHVLQEQSTDPATIDSADLGYFSRTNAGEPLWNAASALPVGVLSKPVKTEFGYHIIEVLDTKGEGSIRAFDTVKADIVGKCALIHQQERIQWLLQTLRAQSPHEVHLTRLEETHPSATGE